MYNNSSSPLSLYGLYITDDFDRMAKFAFAKDAIIPANGFYMVWADEEDPTTGFAHANFKLAAGGEQLMLSDGFSLVLDSITYGTQFDDVATGRCPNGTGNFQFIGQPSFNSNNCKSDTNNFGNSWGAIAIYPNPAISNFTFDTEGTLPVDKITIFDCLGKVVQTVAPGIEKSVSVRTLNRGIYFLEFFSLVTGDRKKIKLVKSGVAD
ncbi:MAG: T9SS type A sorting domain-containing protein [Bacteroidetes bacterium]|nr:T9SS type A sorting domain-containing protein [Bacteroidota bacterium]